MVVRAAGDILAQAAHSRALGKGQSVFPLQETGCIDTGQKAHSCRFQVAFDAGQLAGKEEVRLLAQLQRRQK